MIILQFDAPYHHWGLLLVRSLALHEPAVRVLIDGVNLSHAQVDALQEAHPRIAVENDTTTYEETTPALMICRKPFVMQRAFYAFPDEPWYALLDADLLVRQPLDPLWARLDRHEAALFTTNGMWKGRYYRQLVTPAGIVLVRRDGRALVDSWVRWTRSREPLGGIRPGQWYWDQVTLLEAKTETPLRYGHIPMYNFADVRLRDDAAIWSAHVDDEKPAYYERFSQEYERQRSLLK